MRQLFIGNLDMGSRAFDIIDRCSIINYGLDKRNANSRGI